MALNNVSWHESVLGKDAGFHGVKGSVIGILFKWHIKPVRPAKKWNTDNQQGL